MEFLFLCYQGRHSLWEHSIILRKERLLNILFLSSSERRLFIHSLTFPIPKQKIVKKKISVYAAVIHFKENYTILKSIDIFFHEPFPCIEKVNV